MGKTEGKRRRGNRGWDGWTASLTQWTWVWASSGWQQTLGFSCGLAGKESTCNVGDLGSIPWLGRSPGEKCWLPTPVFWPGEFHGWSHKELDTTEWLSLTAWQWNTGKPGVLQFMGSQRVGQGLVTEHGSTWDSSIVLENSSWFLLAWLISIYFTEVSLGHTLSVSFFAIWMGWEFSKSFTFYFLFA